VAISLESLRSAATRYKGARYRTLNEAKTHGAHRGFLCHSHKDAEYVKGLVQQLSEAGMNLYVDWEDQAMPEVPDRTTAERIQQAIISADFFLFLATPNAVISRWCPWEIGYANGKKQLQQILIVPTADASGKHYGNEYLQLYRQIDTRSGNRLEAVEPGRPSGVSVAQL